MQVVWNVLIRSINVTGKNQQQIQSAISKLVSGFPPLQPYWLLAS